METQSSRSCGCAGLGCCEVVCVCNQVAVWLGYGGGPTGVEPPPVVWRRVCSSERRQSLGEMVQGGWCVLIVFLYNFLDFHFLEDFLCGGSPVNLTYHSDSELYQAVVSKCRLLHGRYSSTPWQRWSNTKLSPPWMYLHQFSLVLAGHLHLEESWRDMPKSLQRFVLTKKNRSC